jgi:leader peptidase (prepilin peptidase)/N-methyltransferase
MNATHWHLFLVILLLFGLWLSIIDIRSHRLPNQVVAAMTLTSFLVQALIALTQSQFDRLIAALATALATTLVYLLLYMCSRGSMGMGDVKFAFPLGLAIGWYNPEKWLSAIFLTFCLAGIVALTGIALKRTSWKSALALGPYMFIASGFVCLISY